MFGEEKNLKDSQKSSEKDTFFIPTLYGQTGAFHLGSYTKTHKLITALYMVTDIIDKDEPLRNKLRTLGTGIISDMHLVQQNNTGYTMSFIFNKVSEIMYFLDIASAVNIISEMNCNILRKEFFELNEAIKQSIDKDEIADRRQIDLSEFFKEEVSPLFKEEDIRRRTPALADVRRQVIGHHASTRIGVQKGSTLMKALNEKMSKRNETSHNTSDVFDELKKERRDSIISIIKTIGTGATIKDIKDKAHAMPEQFKSLMSVSEKTLQRELVSMVQNGVLNKTGEKRWSRYFIKN
ncbi:MAG: hypothetical protein P4L63_00745 [Candidatus Pacebacteria bacterium]|nr:hypothetical protein [Candidatus Paceibacterota bacterium]